MLDNLTDRFTGIVKTLRGHARLTDDNTRAALREVRMALLEADVALPVVKDFIARIREQALGQEVLQSLTPGQALVGVVHDELKALMGGEHEALNFATRPPAVILMAGLQGAGKTTTVAKLAKKIIEEERKKVLTVSADVYRPAAIDQLQTVSGQAGADFFPSDTSQKPVDIATAAIDHARRHYYDVLLIDTAGRLTVDEAMMAEIRALHAAAQPIETLFVVDAMLGQDAVNTARAFNDALPLTGVILTKMDGDARGGAALSVRHITGKPLKFIGLGEKIDALQAFHPDRMASRILGMGDILGLVEEARKSVDEKAALELTKKLKSGKSFDLADFQNQIVQMRKMGGLSSMLDKLPGQFAQMAGQIQGTEQEKAIARIDGIINSMTPQERSQPAIIKASRKRRIAAGAGVPVQEVNRLLKQFEQTRKMMRQFTKGGMGKMMRAMRGIMPGM